MLGHRYTGCIYLATNRINGRAYVGKTIMPLCDRKAIHYHSARRRHTRSPFHAAIRKYGAEAFDWQRLYVSDSEVDLFAAECSLIVDFFAAGVRLYNLGPGGEGQSIPCSAERKAKLSATNTGRKLSPEHCAKISATWKGKPKPREQVEKMRRAKTGSKVAPWSEERRAKFMATWARKKAEGYGHSEEARRKMSEAGKLRTASAEARDVMRERGRLGIGKRWRGQLPT